MPLKHRQDGVWGEDSLCGHEAIDSGRVLKDRSGETATTPKIVTVPLPAHTRPAEKR
jgi:hypothetical protein